MDQVALDRQSNPPHCPDPDRPRECLGLTMGSAGRARDESPMTQPKARVAANSPDVVNPNKIRDVSPAAKSTHHPAASEADPTLTAKLMIADCKKKYASVQDYTCTFFKRERIDGKTVRSQTS